jgi:hypothetical protein
VAWMLSVRGFILRQQMPEDMFMASFSSGRLQCTSCRPVMEVSCVCNYRSIAQDKPLPAMVA